MIAAPAQEQARTGRRWIVCADDFAIDPGSVDGIVDLLERGALTATSALVDSPLWPGAARSLPAQIRGPGAALARRADVGLHLNLTQAFAGQTAPVWSLRELIVRCALGAVARAPVRAAIERQLDAFENEMGRRPDYVDGHQHVHQFAVVRDELIAALRRRYAGMPPWVRSTRPPATVRDAKARAIAALGDAGLRELARSSQIPTSDFLVGVYDFRADRASYWHRLLAWLRKGPEGSVLMCHPAQRAEPGDPIASARLMEFAALGSTDFRAALADAGIALTTGTRLFATGNA